MVIEQPISRKRFYLFILGLNFITSILRLVAFPNMTVGFHLWVFLGTFFVMTLLWEFVLFISTYLEKHLPLKDHLTVRLLIQTVCTSILALILGYILFGFAEHFFEVETPELLNAVAPVLYFLTSALFNLVYIGFYYFKAWKDNLLRTERLLKEQAEVRYDALRNQLNPHFLFNALTSLNSLIFENQQLASDFLQQLSKVYRYTLQHKDKETVSLETEYTFVQYYIKLYKIRFDDAIQFEISIAEADLDKGIAPVTLQILIENAIKHNIVSKDKPLRISITSAGNSLYIKNNIQIKKQIDSSNKQGLQKLKALYGFLSDQALVIEQTENSFTVIIPLI
jgi:two-component system, LytTR family, sensor kinase